MVVPALHPSLLWLQRALSPPLFLCVYQPDALNIALLINTETKRERERKAPVAVIKMSEGQGRGGDWGE